MNASNGASGRSRRALTASEAIESVVRYHDGTKHHFHGFARSLGFLDWASQPHPFRSFDGAPTLSLYPAQPPSAAAAGLPRVTYDQLFGDQAVTAPVTAAAIGDFLRHSLGLSAWKVYLDSRWSLRVNPSSGNLHPTEAYIVTGPLADLSDTSGVWHYAPDRHVIERRCAFDRDAWSRLGAGESADAFFVVLTSIHWREAWKYGERAFRYCQHDLGHAIAALRLSAALFGWRLTIQAQWPQRAVATLTGIDRDEDFVDAEREEPACVLLVGVGSKPAQSLAADASFLDAVGNGRWFGRASQLSTDHVEWTFIDEVARSTEDIGHPDRAGNTGEAPAGNWRQTGALPADRGLDARALMRQRRSAVAFDGVSSTDRQRFIRLLSRAMPGHRPPWDAMWWSPRIHLVLFVHRVTGFESGLYLLARDPLAVSRLTAALRREFLWEPAAEGLPLWLLQRGDYQQRARRLSCDQDIAAEGFFSLGMLADFERSLHEEGPSFYRQLFWESGVIGQVLYLEAEAAGARATGIGCFYDDPVHELLGLDGHAFQSLYHFTVGMPVEDVRLTTEPGYEWETFQPSARIHPSPSA